jgi:hypothetical protein
MGFYSRKSGRRTSVERPRQFVQRRKCLSNREVDRQNQPHVERSLYVPLPVFAARLHGVALPGLSQNVVNCLKISRRRKPLYSVATCRDLTQAFVLLPYALNYLQFRRPA